LKGICAEGLQQRGRKEEIGIWRIKLINIETGTTSLSIRDSILVEDSREPHKQDITLPSIPSILIDTLF
jgi:hypothetical protein